jgi:hypothetical protein
MKHRHPFSQVSIGLVSVAVAAFFSVYAASDARVDRTRKQLQMLDDLYKSAIVLITEHYVKDPSSLSAASASKALFEKVKEKGWQETKLLGFHDKLYNPANAPSDEFEKAAQKALTSGKTSYEQVVKMNGKEYLRYATPVPVVMEKCVMCHANFKDNKNVIGSLSYTMQLID